ncbi:BT4734/BF3469 family protein [Bacteroides fragilis]|uniref:BT4734/BF3469 family protein n=1 Tax=Bacteroides fragilis TaxID=817 RepID=UPI001F451515|nr:BT4734/BF3469 family protein [Bacteroides fragilis]
MKITLIRKEETVVAQRTVKLETVLENMKTETKTCPVSALRRTLKFSGGSGHVTAVDKLPRILFSVELGKSKEVSVMKAYHGLVLLSVKGLTGVEEAVRLRDKLAGLPQTMIAFVGSSGRSVKILVPFLRPDGSLPVTVEEAGLFHAHAYQWAVNFYRGQLLAEHRDVTLENPVPEQSCRYSFDPGLYFNPDAYPIRLEQPLSMPGEVTYRETVEAETDPLQRMMPGYERSEIISTLFETSLYEALNTVDCDREEDSKSLIVELTRNCFRSGIPEEEVVGWTLMHFRGKVSEILIRETVHNVYTVEKRFGSNPCISPKQTMAIRTDEFMGRRYEFRYNILAGMVEYRERKTFCFDFRPVTDRVLNTIAVNAISEGLELWDRDVKRWINSERVPVYSPVTDFLYGLPRWDGKDRIRALARYVPCDNSRWPDFFHRWFLAMVAHWKGNDKQYANSVSPLLIGSQGCGKSTYFDFSKLCLV